MAFKDLLDRTAEDIKQPPLLPIGTYIAAVKKQPEAEEMGGGDWEKLIFQLGVIAPVDVPDEESLREFGRLDGAPIRHDFIFSNASDAEASADNERTLNNVKRFLGNLGCFEAGDGQTLAEALAASVGCQCLVEVSHAPGKKDPEKFYLRVKRTYAE